LFRHAGAEHARRKLQKARRLYIEERTKQRRNLNWEISGLDTLLEENSIDKDTHARLRKLLEIGYDRKRQETRERFGFTGNLSTDGDF
jgi:hypothetical protein